MNEARRQEILKLLAGHLRAPVKAVTARRSRSSKTAFMVAVGPQKLLMEYAPTGNAAQVTLAMTRAKTLSAKQPGAIPIVVAPFMGELGASLCREAGVGWLDLSGNADIWGPGLRIYVEGRPNQFKRVGRPSTAFAPKSSRIARHLLAYPNKSFSQGDLARACRLDQGFTSRIVKKLEADGLVQRAQGLVKVRDPDLLLDAWAESYDFSKHQISRGHIAARGSDELVGVLARAFKNEGIKHALTSLAAAWRMDAFAEYRLVSFYIDKPLSPALINALNFREESRGANVWLIVPNDEGVFDEVVDIAGVTCVHPVQTYLDLSGHPERSKDAAEHLRATRLQWARTA